MIFAKCFAIAWMLGWFFTIFRIVVKNTINGHDVFAGVFALAMTWLLVGFAPVAIVKFGWEFIK